METISIILILTALFGAGLLYASEPVKPESFWQGNHCVQTTVRTPDKDEQFIEAEVDGQWQKFKLTRFPPAFWEWNRQRRRETVEIFREMLIKGREAVRRPDLSGPHNGIVATYGGRRPDSQFALNNAVKGMGFLPPADQLPGMIARLESTLEAEFPIKLDILDSLYVNAEKVFAPDRLVSLELYSEPGFVTQTFINQMLNPACAIVWLDIPTFKVKSIVRLLDPLDPALSEYERNVVRYVNLMHSYFHGAFPRDYIAALYYIVEVYDSSPGKDNGRGVRIDP
ncbi:MAG: hypothetical protein FJ042_00220 [Candidatus Cloacimonetes bacterium]|nr:hypothetical protein [Candidatus Cloacimonadota bacterium]